MGYMHLIRIIIMFSEIYRNLVYMNMYFLSTKKGTPLRIFPRLWYLRCDFIGRGCKATFFGRGL